MIGRHVSGASGKNFLMGSSSKSVPSSTCHMTATAVNCFPSEPDWKMVAGPAGTPCSRFATPQPWALTSAPFLMTPIATPGGCCRCNSSRTKRRCGREATPDRPNVRDKPRPRVASRPKASASSRGKTSVEQSHFGMMYLLFSLQACSISSVTGWNTRGIVNVHGRNVGAWVVNGHLQIHVPEVPSAEALRDVQSV